MRHASIGKRPELEPVEARVLLSTADFAMPPLAVHTQLMAQVQMTEVHGIGFKNRRADLTATLTSNGQPVVGEMVVFRLGGRIVGTANTDSTGAATLTNVRFGRLKFQNNVARIAAVFRGNASLMPIVGRGPLTIGQTTSTSTASLTPASGSGLYGGTATISAALSSNGTAEAGKLVRFVIDGRSLGSAMTDAQGLASLTSVSLAGLDAGSYQVTAVFAGDSNLGQASSAGLLVVSPAVVSISSIGITSKTYDGTTTATIGAGGVLVGVISGDSVAIDTSHATASFASDKAGTDLPVAITGLALSGPDASNYVLSQSTASGIGTITPKVLSVSGVSANDKTYDGTTTATFSIAPGAGLIGVIGTDDVTLVSGLVSASFDTRSAGTARPVSFAGFSLSGGDQGNYTLAPVSAFADILQAPLTISGITAGSKVYDATTIATMDTTGAVLNGVLLGDILAIDASGATGHFADKNVGNGKAVAVDGLTLSGPDAGNYTIDLVAPISADITPATLTVDGFHVLSRAYNGTTNAPLDPYSPSFHGIMPGDSVVFGTYGSASFADGNVGTAKTATLAGVTAIGSDAGNYLIDPTLLETADITPALVTLTGISSSKTYDGTANAPLDLTSASLIGVLGADAVSVDASGVSALFADKNVGTGKAITATGFTLAGLDAGNYTLLVDQITGDITPTLLHINGFSAVNRTYDGTSLVAIGAAGISFGAGDVVSGDDVNFDFSSLSSAVGTMADKTAGANRTVTISGLSISGADAGNYTIVATTTVDIAKATLTVTGIPNLVKNYDGNQYFVSIDTSSASLNGILLGDTVSLNAAGVFGVSTSANVGTWNVFINGLALTGGDASNYNLGATIVSGTIVGP